MSDFESRYAALNDAQREAVDTLEGPLMVVAGPGTGKTELLGLRVANILRKDENVAPANILCLTFTDSAAWNVRDRLVGLIGRDAYRVAIHTFHSFGTEVMNQHPEYFYHGAPFMPADDVTQIEILEDIFGELDYGDPLRSEHNDQFVYLRPAKKAIEYIKRAGLTPDEFDQILAANRTAFAAVDALVQPVFTARVSKQLVPQAEEILKTVAQMPAVPLPGGFDSFPDAFAKSLREALDLMPEFGTAPLTNWKARWTEKGSDKLTHLADLEDAPKIESMAFIYREYVKRMREGGYYDFDDMILDAIAGIEKNPALRAQLAEQYHYILVDEFQDTNDAQMRLVSFLTLPSTDLAGQYLGSNIMVVGDDDQAIFKFQGAEIANILNFQKRYADPKLVVLTKNYRSTQEILDLARKVIRKGAIRLERILPNLTKELVASKKDLAPGAIVGKQFGSRDLEYQWIAKEAGRLIASGASAKEIAVISREHKNLEAIVPFFHAAKIPVVYEREENVLLMPQIIQLVTMAKFVDSVMRKSAEADDLLPEILNYPFWGLDRVNIWELSLRARNEHKPWLMAMRESGGELKAIADFLLDLGAKATSLPAEEILHELIGGPQVILPDETADDNDENETEINGIKTPHEMFSPFRSFYFGKEKFETNRAEYLRFLSGLRSFIHALREYHAGQPVTTADMIEFVETHTKNKLSIQNVDSFLSSADAVQLMVAHKAKGLEFETVFVLDCAEAVWAHAGRGNHIPLPTNLPIGPAGDNVDDQLRLFYVALTRAERLLYLTASEANERGKKLDGLSFLAAEEGEPPYVTFEPVTADEMGPSEESLLIGQITAPFVPAFVVDEKALLAPVLENYQLSVTHFHNFLDVAQAGPIMFLEKNLLRFPEPITPNSAFGSAVHETMSSIYAYVKTAGKLPAEGEILSWFKQFLSRERLNKFDFARMLARGEKALPVFYAAKKDIFSAEDIAERDFRDQGATVAGVPLTGKIDRMTMTAKEIIVIDFKTGKTIASWEPADAYEKIKAWRYRGQLIFYKLLVENSREFGGAYAVNRGVIQFVEPVRGAIGDLELTIELPEVERLQALIAAVYKKIQALDFPDVSSYSKDIRGIRAFEEDLLK
jgi:DNA helicase-2/ATP-dependent DNA helicase PcrA